MMQKNNTSNKRLCVIKIGTQVLTTEDGRLDLTVLRHLVDQISDEWKKKDRCFVIVTSGAITCGTQPLGIKPVSIPEKQAAASVGQILLMKEYAHFFGQYGIHIGQILLTKDCMTDSIKQLNIRNTLVTLFEQNIIPIINENDTVATDEIGEKFGDNDELSCGVAMLIEAEHLVILSDTEGLFTANPKADISATLIHHLVAVTEDTLRLVQDIPNGKSRGGMMSKLTFSKQASEAGIKVTIARGKAQHIIADIMAGKPVGTHIDAQKRNSHV
jgi:glutamate 5-kinase